MLAQVLVETNDLYWITDGCTSTVAKMKIYPKQKSFPQLRQLPAKRKIIKNLQ